MATGKPFKKGNPGKKKGTVHKTTKQAKEMVIELVDYGLEKAKRKLDEIEDPKDYLDTLAKFIGYVMPKKTATDLTTDGQPIIWNEVKNYEPDHQTD
jgi:hypothetical protein